MTRKCSINECGRGHHSRGMCKMHYKRWRRGEGKDAPAQVQYATPAEAFNARTEWRGDCLEWTGATHRNGYGTLSVSGRMVLVHRFAWERANSPIPEGMEIDHICHNRACVNVEHLRLATREENGRNRAGAQPGSRSGVRNVHPNGSGWRVSIWKGHKNYYFGTYPTISDAASVAKRERERLFGEFSGQGTTPSAGTPAHTPN